MNYLREILAFNDYLLMNKLSTGQIALWYGLMYINNKCSWNEWFTASNHVLENLTGLSRQAIVKDRNVLRQKGFLDFKTNGTKATAYKLLTMSDSLQVGLQDSLQDSLQVGLQDSLQDSLPLNKHKTETKTKTIKENKKRKFQPPSVDEVEAYCRERDNGISGQAFVDFYISKGWKVGSNPMKDWKAAVRTWEQRRKDETKQNKEEVRKSKFKNFTETHEYAEDDLERIAEERSRLKREARA